MRRGSREVQCDWCSKVFTLRREQDGPQENEVWDKKLLRYFFCCDACLRDTGVEADRQKELSEQPLTKDW